jgi:hypothetical protein
MSYYYFAASLPMLMPDHPPPFSVEDFRRQCATHLAPRDMDALDDLLGHGATRSTHPFAHGWRQADGLLRNALARIRAERLRQDAGVHTRDVDGVDTAIDHAVAEAYNRPSPLEREKALDHIRWRRLETLAGLDPFSGSAVLAYGMQLTILERWARMDKEAGSATVDTLVRRRPADEEKTS